MAKIDWSLIGKGEFTDAQFRAFHEENKIVAAHLLVLARRQRDAKVKRISMKMLFEVLRYNESLKTQGEHFKLNNNYTAYYVRLLEQVDPSLKGMFERRRSKADTSLAVDK